MVESSEHVVAPAAGVVEGLDHWRTLEAHQQPPWPDAEKAAAVGAELSEVPPLVFAGEVDMLRDRPRKPLPQCSARSQGRSVPAPGWGLCRDFCWRNGGPDSQPSKDDSSDGRRVDLRSIDAGHQNGSDGGPICKTPLQ